MKRTVINIVLLLMAGAGPAMAQGINWSSFATKEKHIADVHTGYDYGFMAAIGYGYKLNVKLPVLLNAEFAAPFGRHTFDDFKTKLGGTACVAQMHNFAASVSAYGVFRRHQSEFATLAGFGSEFGAAVGYYRSKWYVAAEAGFDKAIVTHIKNTPLMKETYAEVKDGWYIPTAGNLFYGIRSGLCIGRNDFYLKAGKTMQQDLKTNSIIPFYLQVGVTRKLGR